MAYVIRNKDTGQPVVVRDHKLMGSDFFDGEVKEFNDKERSLVAVANQETPDRLKDTILVNGWNLKNYRKNPVVMAFHNYGTLPVGRSRKVWKDEKDGIKRLLFQPQFANYEDTIRLYEMYKDKYLKGFSVGFIPLEYKEVAEEEDEKDKDKKKDDKHRFLDWKTPIHFTKSELLEVSVAPIPAHPDALAEIKGLVQKGKLYIPARYLHDDEYIEVQAFGSWSHAKVAEKGEFVALYEEVLFDPTLNMEVTLVYGKKEQDSDEYHAYKYIVPCCKVEDDDLIAMVKENGKSLVGSMLEVLKSDNAPAKKLYEAENYLTDEACVLVDFKALEEEAFSTEAAKKDAELDAAVEPVHKEGVSGEGVTADPDLTISKGGSEVDTPEDVVIVPVAKLPDEHSTMDTVLLGIQKQTEAIVKLTEAVVNLVGAAAKKEPEPVHKDDDLVDDGTPIKTAADDEVVIRISSEKTRSENPTITLADGTDEDLKGIVQDAVKGALGKLD